MSTLVIDGNNILSRAIHAAGAGRMTSEAGVDTGALVLFSNMLSKYLRMHQPTRVCVCWDDGRSTYRTRLYAAYKSSRSEKGDEQDVPFALAQQFCSLLGLPQCSFPGVEADDLIAAYWRQRPLDESFGILSGDKDFLQLIDHETVFQIRPGVNPEVWGVHTVTEHLGVYPEVLPLYMALTGDPGDDVPGVPGVGPKKAVKILAECDYEWDRVLEHPKVAEHQRIADLSLGLVDLRHISVEGLEPIPVLRDLDSSGRERLLTFLASHDLTALHERVADRSFWNPAT